MIWRHVVKLESVAAYHLLDMGLNFLSLLFVCLAGTSGTYRWAFHVERIMTDTQARACMHPACPPSRAGSGPPPQSMPGVAIQNNVWWHILFLLFCVEESHQQANDCNIGFTRPNIPYTIYSQTCLQRFKCEEDIIIESEHILLQAAVTAWKDPSLFC